MVVAPFCRGPAMISASRSKRRHGVALHELVNKREGGGHPAGQRGVPGRGLERVDPHDPAGDPGQAGHLLPDQLRGRPDPTRRCR